MPSHVNRSIPDDEFDFGYFVQPLFDKGEAGAPDSWRQARIALSPFAGQENLRLRFEFSTAGGENLGHAQTTGDELYTVAGQQDPRRADVHDRHERVRVRHGLHHCHVDRSEPEQRRNLHDHQPQRCRQQDVHVCDGHSGGESDPDSRYGQRGRCGYQSAGRVADRVDGRPTADLPRRQPVEHSVGDGRLGLDGVARVVPGRRTGRGDGGGSAGLRPRRDAGLRREQREERDASTTTSGPRSSTPWRRSSIFPGRTARRAS